MKFKIKDEDLATRDLEEAVRRLPLKMRLAGVTASDILKYFTPGEIFETLTTEEILKTLKTDELKKLKKMLDKLNLN